MQHKSKYLKYTSLLLALLPIVVGCKKKDYEVPVPKDVLQNDCIKRTQGPNMVGDTIEFAYAMAILPEKGKLVAAHVEASIDGAAGTYLEHRSYYSDANNSGRDVGITVGDPSVTSKNVTTVTFTRDTMAATLRYYYMIPEAARGQTVSFTFSVESSDGQTATYKMGPYTISKMDMKQNIAVSDGNRMYISIADMAAYNATDAAARAGSIDLVYLYRTYSTSTFNHAFVSPGADAQYLPGVSLPAGVNRSSYIREAFNIQDFNLSYGKFGVYVDDPDFEKLNLSNEPNFAINVKLESGLWVETADHKYRAYIFVNTVTNSSKSAVISMKRYAL
jgi:hypothetical protein